MTPDQFNAAVRRTRIKPAAAGWAREVLVDGQRIADVARRHGAHRQAVSRAVQRIRAELLRAGRCPTCGRP